jgi:hypothetical protein
LRDKGTEAQSESEKKCFFCILKEFKEGDMSQFKNGDKVRIKDQADWPKPPGFVFAGAEGTVAHSDFDELMEDYDHLVFVQLDKVGAKAEAYKNVGLWFLADQVAKR